MIRLTLFCIKIMLYLTILTFKLFIIIGIFCFKVFAYVIAAIFSIIISIFSKHNYSKINFANIDFDNMDGHKFEYFCANLLEKNNFYGVKVTKGSGDHGVDITANRNGVSYAIQCKCYSQAVGNKAVQEAYSGKAIYKKDIAVVMTNNFFSKQAIDDAKTLGVLLWDRNILISLLNSNNNI